MFGALMPSHPLRSGSRDALRATRARLGDFTAGHTRWKAGWYWQRRCPVSFAVNGVQGSEALRANLHEQLPVLMTKRFYLAPVLFSWSE